MLFYSSFLGASAVDALLNQFFIRIFIDFKPTYGQNMKLWDDEVSLLVAGGEPYMHSS